MIWISHINHDMLENIWYLPWYMSVWEYLISAVIYQVCSVREHLIEIMIHLHFCKKTWCQPWRVLLENICYKLWYVFRYRMSDINHDMCSVGEYHILTIYFFREYPISTMIHILKRKSNIMCCVRKHLISAMISVLWENIWYDQTRHVHVLFCYTRQP